MAERTPCSHTETQPQLVEEAILNYRALPPSLKGWRRFRIEYGHECSCPEGIIYLPPEADAEVIERELNKHRKDCDVNII